MDTQVVTTRYGKIIGKIADQDVMAFLGIPYAATPYNALFQKPQEPNSWSGILKAQHYGPTAPQQRSAPPYDQIFPTQEIQGENYLTLNIWTSHLTKQSPVMVFIHGGSFTSGSGAFSGYAGTSFAKKGVVLVTINYRLGIAGFAYTKDGTLNNGLLDQVQALKWVKENIGAFGGNPANVTIFGESAGGMSIGTLLAMPAAKGLFHKAILESGAASHTISLVSAKKIAAKLAEILGVPMVSAELSRLPTAKLLAAQKQMAQLITQNPSIKKWGNVALKGLPFAPVVDGETVLEEPLDAIQGDDPRPLLIGWNSEEANILLVPSGLRKKIRGWFTYYAAHRYQLPMVKTVRQYHAVNPFKKAAKQSCSLLTDIVYRVPAVRLAEKIGTSFVYEFGWQSQAFNGTYGAGHAVELPYVFNNLAEPVWQGMLGTQGNQVLADEVQNAWIAFAATGNPGWEAYQKNQKVHLFGAHHPDFLDQKERLAFLNQQLTVL